MRKINKIKVNFLMKLLLETIIELKEEFEEKESKY